MKIIAFGYEARAGKNTCGELLANTLTGSTQVIAIASSLKSVCHDIYGWAGLMDEKYYENFPLEKEEILPKIGLSPREIWIKFGTLVAREVYPATWIKRLIHTYSAKVDYLIVTDLRFKDEFEILKQHGAINVRVMRPTITSTELQRIAENPHMAAMPWDYYITNNGTLFDLAQEIKNFAEKFCE